MKKAYTKPEIVFESFSLSQNIAAGCEEKIEGPSAGNCGVDFVPGQTIFFDSMVGVCNISLQEGDPYNQHDSLCYHTFADTANIFNS